MIILDDQIISAPVVDEPISGGVCQISGGFSQEEAQNLAALILVSAGIIFVNREKESKNDTDQRADL